MIPPGDIRNCLAALSDDESRIAEIFQYRFGTGDGLNGHAHRQPRAGRAGRRHAGLRRGRGNRGADARTSRDRAAGDVRGRDAGRRVRDGRVLSGETTIARAGGPIAQSRAAAGAAALFCAGTATPCGAPTSSSRGPGSLYTSILPPLLVPDIAEAILESRAVRILVANLMTEAGRDRPLQRARAPAHRRAPRRTPAVRLRDLQHHPCSRAARGDLRGAPRDADRDRHASS